MSCEREAEMIENLLSISYTESQFLRPVLSMEFPFDGDLYRQFTGERFLLSGIIDIRKSRMDWNASEEIPRQKWLSSSVNASIDDIETVSPTTALQRVLFS